MWSPFIKIKQLFHSDNKPGVEASFFKHNSNTSRHENDYKLSVEEFKNRYDLTGINSIMAIPPEETKKYRVPVGKSEVKDFQPADILDKKATEYKKQQKYDLAIACLKKSNELKDSSPYEYSREDYERVVDIMVLSGKFEEAKQEHKKLNGVHGTRLKELEHLRDVADAEGWENKEDYQKRIVDPYVEKSRDREQYYWLLENIPAIAPKSFNGYRRIKKTNSSSYQKIVKEVTKSGNTIEALKFWIN